MQEEAVAMNINTRLHILGHVALKLAALAGALGGLLLITTIMLPPRAAQATTWLNGDRLPFNGADEGACAIRNGALLCWGGGVTRQSRKRP
jgi:hypothetical protein